MPFIMKAKHCFHCNGVEGRPGKVMSQSEISQMGDLSDSLIKNGLIEVEEVEQAPQESAEPESEAAPAKGKKKKA